jgi:hypothetical protein
VSIIGIENKIWIQIFSYEKIQLTIVGLLFYTAFPRYCSLNVLVSTQVFLVPYSILISNICMFSSKIKMSMTMAIANLYLASEDYITVELQSICIHFRTEIYVVVTLHCQMIKFKSERQYSDHS